MEIHDMAKANADMKALLRLFVYGTLKRGYWNHERFCRSAILVEEATVQGRLYELPSGIPVLRVPDEDILATGTRELLIDVATQERFATGSVQTLDDRRTGDDWDWVHGELMTFDDPETRLPQIDCLEGFRPGRCGLYRRLLVPVAFGATTVPAWCYVADEALVRDATPTGRTSWP